MLAQLVELHADEPALLAELDAVALDLLSHPGRHLSALEHDEHVVERHGALELERGQPGQALVEPLAVRLERAERLVRAGEHVGDLAELIADLVAEDGHRLALLGDRDHESLGLLGDALGRAVPGARLRGGDRRVGHQLDVRVDEPAQVGVDDDRAVHLGQLVQPLSREGKVETHAAREEKGEVRGLADDE